MDTVSSPVFPIARTVQVAGLLLALAIVTLVTLVLLGANLDAVARPDPAEPLLGPFRWAFRNAV